MTSKEWSEHRFKIKLSVKPTQKYTICLFLRVSISHLGAIIFKTLGFYTSQISLFSHHGVPTWYFFSQKKNQIYLIDTKHKISAGLHYVSVRASINNIRRAEQGPHLLQGPGTCCGKLPRVSSDQGAGAECTIWTWSRTGEQTVFTTVTNRGPVWGRGCLVSHIVNINITHESGPRPQQERTLPVCEHWTLWTLSAGPPPIMIMASFFSRPPTSSSSQRLNTD